MQGKPEQWEGFEQFCESQSVPEGTQINEQKKQSQSTQIVLGEDMAPFSKKQTIDQKPKTSPYKKTKIKIKVHDLSPKRQEETQKLPVQPARNQTNNEPESPQKLTVRNIKYERIPIMRKQDDFRYTGNIVYRSFAPRSSDTYFRTLKEVDYTAPVSENKFKGNQMYCFNSRIESGNLGSVFQVGESEFDLYMRVDTNTNGHRQWFYFSVKNLVAGIVRFNIYRFKKKFSLFQRGMRPYVFSMKSKSGWKGGCTKIAYRQQKFNSETKQNQSPSFYLTFQYRFQSAEDEVHFASGIPYTVSYLNKRLSQLSAFPQQYIEFQVSSFGKTLCGQDLQLISIAPKAKSPPNYIIINTRTHAGETSSSWVLDGLLQRLINDQKIRKWINQCNIHFKIVPMLNPDGVFVGNYRTGILGQDFNRKFATGKKQLFPQIFALKKLVSDCKRSGKVLLFLDLHGHSVLKNSFIYGPSQSLYSQHPLRNFPFTLWHQSKYFRLSSCKFKFSKDMTETARIYFQIKQNILSYTCQISLGLYYQGNTTIQMLEEDYRSLGQAMVGSFAELLTKEKVISFKNTQESSTIATIMKSSEVGDVLDQSKNTIRQSIKKETEVKISSKKQKHRDRETCLQKIKSIKKQLIQQQNQLKRDIKILQQDSKTSTKQKSRSLNRRKLELSYNIETMPDKMSRTNKYSFLSRKGSDHDIFQLNNDKSQEEASPLKAARIEQKKAHREAQFKIRRKSDAVRMLPESLRKKLGPKIELGFTSTKHFKGEEQEEFVLERSATYDSPYLSTQIQAVTEDQQHENQQQQYDLQIINQRFSEEYESMNDSDNSSEDLGQKQKQYLIECIKNKKMKTNNEEQQDNIQDHEQETEQAAISTTVNINGFKQIRFKSIEASATKTMFPMRNTKRDVHKFRDITHKSLGRNALYEEQGTLMPQMVQKKQLNERINKKNVREPYFLVQIKNKNH